MQPTLISASEAADLLGLSVATVHRWAEVGKLAVAYKGNGRRGARLFARSEVERLATERAAS